MPLLASSIPALLQRFIARSTCGQEFLAPHLYSELRYTSSELERSEAIAILLMLNGVA